MHNFKNIITTTNNLTNVNKTLSIDYKKTDAFALTFTLSICFIFIIIVIITCMADVLKNNCNNCKCCKKKTYFQNIIKNVYKNDNDLNEDILDYSSLPPHLGGNTNYNIKNKDKAEYAIV